MERNKYFLLSIILLFFAYLLYTPAALAAQEPGYFIDYSGLKPRIMQKLAWNNEENAMHYDVEIQIYSQVNELYEFSKTITVNNYLDVYLSPGKYRYNVTAFDYLGRPGEPSEWIDFEIITAYHPVVEKYSPDAFFLDQNKKRELIVSGSNLSEESTIYLRNLSRDLFPVSVNFIDDDMLALSFDDETLPAGSYEVYAINPGGLESVIGGFRVGYRKFFDVFLKASYMPVFPLYGKSKDDFPEFMYTAGFFTAVEFISSPRTMFNGGVEISYSSYMLSPYLTPYSDINNAWYGLFNNNGIIFNDFDVNVSVQKRFNKRKMAVTLRFGLGFSLAEYSEITEREDYDNITYDKKDFTGHINLGLSYMLLVLNIFYLDFGADFDHHIIGNQFGIIKPRLALVWKF